jgi:predicted secreted protein
MARRHGKNGEVMMDPTGSTTYVAVASLNSWTLDAASDNVDVTCFGDTNKQYVKGLPDYKGDIGGVWDAADVSIFDAAFAGTPVGLKLIPSTLDAAAFFSGLGYVDAGIDCPADGAVTIKGTWVAAGNWTMAP